MSKCVVLSCASTFFNTAHLCGAKTWGPESPLKPTVAESFSFVLAQRSFPPMPSLSAPPCLASAPKQVLGLEGQLEVGCSPSVCEALGPCTTTEQSLGPNLAWMKERGKNRPCRFIYQASAGTQGGLQVFDFHKMNEGFQNIQLDKDEPADLGCCQNTGLTSCSREPEDP